MTKTKKQTGAADRRAGGRASVERSPDRVQFDALRVEKDKLAARSAPLREQRDAIGNEIRALEKKEESVAPAHRGDRTPAAPGDRPRAFAARAPDGRPTDERRVEATSPMLILSSTSDKLQVITSAAVTVDVHASWVDNASGSFTAGRTNTAITTAATTDVVASPAASTQRNIKNVNIRNKHASSSNTVTVQHTDGTTVAQLFSYTLLAGEEIQYDDEGWQVFDATGSLKTATRVVGIDLQTFSTPGAATWTKPAGATSVEIIAVGAGGAGGAGIASTAAGGGGGGGGGYVRATFRASEIGATLALSVGAKGVGGSTKSAATDSTVTDNGTGGTGNVIVTAKAGTIGADAASNSGGAGGAGGGKGSLVAAASGSPGTQALGSQGAGGATGATTGGIGGKGDFGGGGGGGGKNAANSTGVGGTSEFGGGGGGGGGSVTTGAAGGVGGAGQAGGTTPGGSATAATIKTLGGSGGAGGTTGNGGNGAQPGGGGGGGGGAANSGGNGGDGAITIITHF
jgi:hypothetical protein